MVKNLEISVWLHSLNQVFPNLCIWSQQFLPPLFWSFQLILSLLGPGSLLLSSYLGLSVGYPQFSIPNCYTSLFSFPTLCISSQSAPIVFPPLLFLPSLYRPLPPVSILFPPSKKNLNIHTLVFLLVDIHIVCELYHGYCECFA